MDQTPLIQFRPEGSLNFPGGIQPTDLTALQAGLESARAEMLEVDLPLFHAGGPIAPEKQPLDAGFMDLPDRILHEYENDRHQSELAQILNIARRIQSEVDRVVILGIGGSYMGARALHESCMEPYFNEMTESDRGGRPRVYFAGCNLDNDSTQGLLQLLTREKGTSKSKRWAIVVISKSGGTIETAVALRHFLAALKSSLNDPSLLSRLVVPVTGQEGRLSRLADAIGCVDRFSVPEGVGGRFSVLSAVGLLPAAIMGLDVVQLLRGAWLMNAHFRSAPFGENCILDFVATNHAMEQIRGANIRILSAWSDALEAVGLWYDQLFAESLGKNERGATPLTVVNTRDLHSRAQQHQEGQRNKIINNLVVDSWRYDPLAVEESDWNQDELNELAGFDLPTLMSAAIAGTDRAYREDNRPTTTIRLPAINENSLGQLFQMLMLATVAEGRLMGINPFGQPGVERYKQNMKSILQERQLEMR